jgi:hypothetical protein
MRARRHLPGTVSNGAASAQTNVSVPVVLPSNFVLQNATISPSTRQRLGQRHRRRRHGGAGVVGHLLHHGHQQRAVRGPAVTLTDATSDGFTAMSAVSSIGGTSFAQPGPNQFQWTGIDLTPGTSATFVLGRRVEHARCGERLREPGDGAAGSREIDTNPVYNDIDSDTVVAIPLSITWTPPVSGLVGTPATLSATGGGSGCKDSRLVAAAE